MLISSTAVQHTFSLRESASFSPSLTFLMPERKLEGMLAVLGVYVTVLMLSIAAYDVLLCWRARTKESGFVGIQLEVGGSLKVVYISVREFKCKRHLGRCRNHSGRKPGEL